uniref:Troponin I n=1 Tax=Romanomermis culicivorax TaxID=13658 RepID=A0A915KRM1_ROMCU
MSRRQMIDDADYGSSDQTEDQIRGGPQSDEDEAEAKRKMEERERKKAEVRKRLEEAGRAKKAKKGFLTPERKKKLRQLLMKKAAEDLKQQQLLKEQERQKILSQRIIALPDVDSIADLKRLQDIASQFHAKIAELEDSKYDLEYNVRQKDFEINELTIQVNDLRGKFVKPTLKKVSKYDNKFAKLQKKPEQTINFRENLRQVKTDKFGLEQLKGGKDEKKEGEATAD